MFEKELNRSGVYVLTGINQDGKPEAYIGESENVVSRLQYQSTKNASIEWTEALVFVSLDETLTKGHVRFAEAELIKSANENPHWIVSNDKKPPTEGKLPKPDEYFMRDFVEQVKTLAGTLGCSVFKSVSGKPKQEALFDSSQETNPREPQQTMFQMAGDGYSAAAVLYLQTGEFSVLRGSTARIKVSPAAPKSAKAIRDQLVADGVLEEIEGSFQFTMDYGFSSTSAAAAVVSGNSMAGPVAWKLASDPSTTYKQWKEEQEQ